MFRTPTAVQLSIETLRREPTTSSLRCNPVDVLTTRSDQALCIPARPGCAAILASVIDQERVYRADYASAGLKIEAAESALKEGIPNKQRDRVRAAYFALLEGVDELNLWLGANGYLAPGE